MTNKARLTACRNNNKDNKHTKQREGTQTGRGEAQQQQSTVAIKSRIELTFKPSTRTYLPGRTLSTKCDAELFIIQQSVHQDLVNSISTPTNAVPRPVPVPQSRENSSPEEYASLKLLGMAQHRTIREPTSHSSAYQIEAEFMPVREHATWLLIAGQRGGLPVSASSVLRRICNAQKKKHGLRLWSGTNRPSLYYLKHQFFFN